jgi:hypothetical protein
MGGIQMCNHHQIMYGEINRDDYEMRREQQCVCLECGQLLGAPIRNGKANYWWEKYNEFFPIRKGRIVIEESTTTNID